MDVPVTASIAPLDPIVVLRPARQTIPVVFASPHSGRLYPEDMMAAAALDAHAIRRSEDALVDELIGRAPELGAPDHSGGICLAALGARVSR